MSVRQSSFYVNAITATTLHWQLEGAFPSGIQSGAGGKEELKSYGEVVTALTALLS